MSLVAYSDESDASGDEEKPQPTPLQSKNNISSLEVKDTESINSKDEAITEKLKLIPQPCAAAKLPIDITDDNDVVNDVPTVETWGVTKNLNHSSTFNGSSQALKTVHNSKKSKLKLILPALSEFDDDEEDQQADEISSRKKIKTSEKGSGLFGLLPKARDATSLIPYRVQNKAVNRTVSKAKNVKVSKAPAPDLSYADSDEEDISHSKSSDFFSLSESPPINTVPDVKPAVALPSSINIVSLEENLSHISEPEIHPVTSSDVRNVDLSYIPLQSTASDPLTDAGLDIESLRRLAGGRNKGEIPNIIDINADDALMAKDEWVIRNLCDEKPKKSFSSKREGNPTHQQKRKHQITFLAHQAQEREQELQNSWGQNRFAKLQTQSRYGF